MIGRADRRPDCEHSPVDVAAGSSAGVGAFLTSNPPGKMLRSMIRPRSTVLAATCLALACGDPSAAGSAKKVDAAPQSGPAKAPEAAAAKAPEATAPKAAGSKAMQGTAPDRALLKHLAEGRKLVREKKYKEGIAALEKALALHDGDAKALAELGYAALLDKDLDRSRKASERALKATSDPKARASILYNLGRVHEEKGDKPAAARAYAESLSLRDNAEVKKRIDALGDQGAKVEVCSAAFASVDELCGCLKGSDELLILDGPRTCAPKALDLKSDRLQILDYGVSEVGTHSLEILVAKDKDGFRWVSTLGELYQPGAFGVYNEPTFGGVALKTIGGKSVAVISYTQNHNDSNLAGLELCFERTKYEVLCVLDEVTRCPFAVTLEAENGCGTGVEIGPEETDPEVIAAAKQIKEGSYTNRATASYAIDDAGVATVKLESGEVTTLPAGMVGPHKLW